MSTVVQDVSGDTVLQNAIAALKAKIEGAEESGDIAQLISDISTALDGKQNTLTFDSTPTAGSSNPVTSGGVKTALDGKQDTLTFDSEPTAESTKPVTSGGVKAALDVTNADIGELKENLTDLQELADTKAAAIYETASGEIASFSDGADDMPMKSCVVNIEPIQEGEGDPSPENVRPISGRTGLSVARTGVNVLNLSEWEYESNSGITIGADNISVIAKGDQERRNRYNVLNRSAYVLSFHVKTIALSNPGAVFAMYADETKLAGSGTNYLGNISLDSVGAEKDITLTVPSGTEYISIGGWGYEGEVQISNIQLVPGSTATDYEPYKGNTYSVNWETEAGTLYGGTLDIVSGKLTVDKEKIVYNGSEPWAAYNSQNGFLKQIPRMATGTNLNGKANWLKTVTSVTQFGVSFGSNSNIVYYYHITDNISGVTNVDTWKAYLANNNLEVCYPLATPIEIQLTPQEIRTLLGVNNVWSDAGSMAVEYPADTKMYIDTKIVEAVAAAMA